MDCHFLLQGILSTPGLEFMSPLLAGGFFTTEPPEMRVRSLGQEDLLEKEMAIHSSILAWKIP